MKGNRDVKQQILAEPTRESTIGFDLGDRWSRYCMIDSRGVVAKARHLVVSEIKLRCLNLNYSSGDVLDIQLDGGARFGYSGGPVVVKRNGVTHCVGLTVWGGAHSRSTIAIGLARIRTFLAQHLPPSLSPLV